MSVQEPLSPQALNTLLALGVEVKHGYAIMQTIEEDSGGSIQILPGTLYSTIKKLVSAGLVEECSPPEGTDSTDARRRYYRVTERGREAARAETERLAILVRLGKVFENDLALGSSGHE